MVGYRHAAHAVAYGLVNQTLDARLSVEYRVVCVYMKMYEIFHCVLLIIVFEGVKLRLNSENTKKIHNYLGVVANFFAFHFSLLPFFCTFAL